MSLPSIEIMTEQILAVKGMTKAKLKKKLKEHEDSPFFKNAPKIFYNKIAQELGIDVTIEYTEGSAFDEGPEWMPIEEYTASRDTKMSFNVRGVVLRVGEEKESKTTAGKFYRFLGMIDETDSVDIAAYGELREVVQHLKVGDLVRVSGASVYTPSPDFIWRSVNDRFGDIETIKYGEYDFPENALFKIPISTIQEVMREVPNQGDGFVSYMIRGIFTSKEKGSRTIAICPECRAVHRGDPGIKSFCPKCPVYDEDGKPVLDENDKPKLGKSVYTVPHVISKFGFVDDDGTQITVQFAKSSKVDTSTIKEFDPPDEWNYYILRGTMATDEHDQAKEAFYAIDALLLPNVDPNAEAEEEVEETLDDKHDREVEEQAKREDLVNSLDFKCDEGAFWPNTAKEQTKILNDSIDDFNNFISMLGAAEPKDLQNALKNMNELEKKWTVRPIVIHLFENEYLTIKDGLLHKVENK